MSCQPHFTNMRPKQIQERPNRCSEWAPRASGGVGCLWLALIADISRSATL